MIKIFNNNNINKYNNFICNYSSTDDKENWSSLNYWYL